jgi:hypothetical protein
MFHERRVDKFLVPLPRKPLFPIFIKGRGNTTAFTMLE